jgi:hypothetical protein
MDRIDGLNLILAINMPLIMFILRPLFNFFLEFHNVDIILTGSTESVFSNYHPLDYNSFSSRLLTRSNEQSDGIYFDKSLYLNNCCVLSEFIVQTRSINSSGQLFYYSENLDRIFYGGVDPFDLEYLFTRLDNEV